MILVLRVLYIALIGYLFYRMFKNGGCCGGNNHHKNIESDGEAKKNTVNGNIITENEKKKAIVIETESKA